MTSNRDRINNVFIFKFVLVVCCLSLQTHPQVAGLEAVLSGCTEGVCCDVVTLDKFGGDEDAACGQTVRRDRYRERDRQEPVHERDGQREHGLITATLTAHLEGTKRCETVT